MELSGTRIMILGCGPGAPEYMADAVRQAAARADVLIGSRRLLAMFPEHPGRQEADVCKVDNVMADIGSTRMAGRSVAVLVSGDPGLYSLARNITARFGRENCEVVPGISSLQVAFARLGLDWADARWISAHGRTPEIPLDELARWDKMAVLAGSRDAIAWAARAAETLQASHAVFLCENLTLPEERVREMTPGQLAATEAASLAIVLLIRRSAL